MWCFSRGFAVIDLKGEASQDRQARVALMRSRFAETILKAQEKSLPMDKVN